MSVDHPFVAEWIILGSGRVPPSEPGGSSAKAAAGGRDTPHSALVFGPVGVHNALNGLVDLVEDEGAG
jgi:hypothetical protein